MDILARGKSAAQREDEGQVVHLRDEDGEKMYYTGADEAQKPVTITVAGTYSSVYRRAQDAQRDKMVKRRSMDGEQLDRGQLGITAACILAWNGLEAGGQPLPLSKQNAIAVLDAAPWIRDQIETAMNDHEGFSSGRSKT